MGFDEEEDDELGAPSPSSQPLPPEDRLWRHPSELAGTAAAGSWPPATDRGGRRGRSATVLALASAGLVGAVVAVGAMWVVRPTRVVTDPATATTTRPEVSFASTEGSAAAARAAASLTVVQVERDGSWSEAPALWLGDGALLVAASLVEGADQVAVIVGSDDVPALVAGSDATTAVATLLVAEGDGPRPATARPDAGGSEVSVVGYRSRTALAEGTPRVVAAAIGETDARATVDGQLLHGTIRLDRALPADAVGSLVVDRDGRTVGLVVSAAADDGMAVAVAAPEALAAGDDLGDDGEVRRAWLGVRASDIDVATARATGARSGAELQAVQAGSPAATAGLQAGDVIVAVDDEPVGDASDLVVAIRGWTPGEEVEITWHRGTDQRRTVVTLGG